MVLNGIGVKGPNGMGSHHASVQHFIGMKDGGRQISDITSIKAGIGYSEMVMLRAVKLIEIGYSREVRFDKEVWDIQFINFYFIHRMSFSAPGEIDGCF
jgi:hypothetical protein